jgi:hypothetical protein
LAVFLEGPSGTEKTFIYNTLNQNFKVSRIQGQIVCVDSTGIAAPYNHKVRLFILHLKYLFPHQRSLLEAKDLNVLAKRV